MNTSTSFRKKQLRPLQLLAKQTDSNVPSKWKILEKRNISCILPQKPKLRQTDSTTSSKYQQNPTVIEDFIKIKSLGKGKYGEVSLVVHKETGFIGALKTIAKSYILKDKKTSQQLVQQIKIQSFLNHRNIVSLYTYFYDWKNVYLFMELGCHGQLYHTMENYGVFYEETIGILVRELLNGLVYLHNEDVIHRDLKPQNIVIVHGVPKICDFGWAAYCPRKYRNTFCGTPLYLSPEILSGGVYNEKIDTWAIGALTYELFAGQNPFKITTQKQLQKIILQDFHMDSGSQQFRQFISMTLCKNPSERPQALTLRNHYFILKYQKLQTSEQLCQASQLY